MSGHIVTSRVVKVSVGDARGNTVARILRQGSLVPEGVDPKRLEALVARGLVTKVEAPAEPTEPAPAPDANPLDALTVEELKAYAADKGFDLGGATKKADILAAIDAAAAASEQA